MGYLKIQELYSLLPRRTQELWADWRNFSQTMQIARKKGLIEGTYLDGRTVMYPEKDVSVLSELSNRASIYLKLQIEKTNE